jgi:hypothetical protein
MDQGNFKNAREMAASVSPLVVFFCSVVIAAYPLDAHSSIGGGGFKNRGLFVQEYWKHGRPFYAIANMMDSTAHIVVQQDGPVVAKWRVEPKQVAYFEVSALSKTQDVRLLLNGQSLGTLEPMRRSDYELAQPGKSPEVITNTSTNQWGGTYSDFLWFEQESMVFKADEDIQLTLVVRGSSGIIAFGPYELMWSFVNPGLEGGRYEWDFPCPLLLPTRATSTVPWLVTEDQLLRIDTDYVGGRDHFYRVSLYFHTPAVRMRTPVIISGFRRVGPSSGHWITRMILVEP